MARHHVWQQIVDHLVTLARTGSGRSASPSLGIIDSQSVATADGGGPRGLDAAKRINGRKRHIVTDTDGNLLALHVHPVNVQDCHGAVALSGMLRGRFPTPRHRLADRVYRGDQRLRAIAPSGEWTIEIIQRPPGTKGFRLPPRRRVVERTFAGFGRRRRLAKDFEGTLDSSAAWLLLAHLRLLSRRLAKTAEHL